MVKGIEEARAAKAQAKVDLAGFPGIVGIGLTKVGADHALKINLREPPPRGTQLPTHILGIAVQSEIVGAIRKRNT